VKGPAGGPDPHEKDKLNEISHRFSIMKYRRLGKTGINISEISFGCGSIGGLMVRGGHADQVRAVKHAVDCGINYFDTAANYGGGQSETSLGLVLEELKPDVFVGTKVSIPFEQSSDINGAIRRSLEGSLKRLRRDSIDLLQLHSPLAAVRARTERGDTVTAEDVLRSGGVADVFEQLRAERFFRFIGFTALGETNELLKLVASGRFDTVQAYYNLVNPSAGKAVPENFSAQDFGLLMDKARDNDMGILAIRTVAAGAMGGDRARQGYAVPTVDLALAGGADYALEIQRAAKIAFLAGADRTLPQAAVRFALDHSAVSSAVIGFSDVLQIDEAVAASAKASLSPAEEQRLRALWDSDFEDQARRH